MRFWLPLALLKLAACTQTKTTPPGKLGAFDFSANLPAGVAKPADTELTARSAKTTVCQVDSYAGADVEIRWKTFQRDTGSYIASAEVELSKPADGLEVSVKPFGEPPIAGLLASKTYLAVATLAFDCQRKTLTFTQSGGPIAQIDATGKLIDDPKGAGR